MFLRCSIFNDQCARLRFLRNLVYYIRSPSFCQGLLQKFFRIPALFFSPFSGERSYSITPYTPLSIPFFRFFPGNFFIFLCAQDIVSKPNLPTTNCAAEKKKFLLRKGRDFFRRLFFHMTCPFYGLKN